MKKFLYVIALSLFTFSGSAWAQCSGGTLNGNITPTLVYQPQLTSDGQYYTFNATAGGNYYFSFCPADGGNAFFDSQITILDNSGNFAGGYNDDFCGLQSYLVWNCPSSATYRVLISTFFCSTSGNTGTFVYKTDLLPSPIDMGVSAFVSPPANPGCITGNQTVTVTVTNYGSNNLDFSVTPLTVNCSVTGPNPTTFPAVVISSGTLAPSASQNVVISTTYNMSANGTYAFTASTSISGDGNSSNDSFGPYNVDNSALASVAAVTPTSICAGSTVNLNSAVTNAPTTSYTVTSVPYAPLTGSSAPLNSFTSNDDGYQNVPLPFNFNFFGNTYTDVNVETNGYVDFGFPNPNFVPQTVPNSNTPNNFIALCWTDLYVQPGSSIDTFTVGTAPFRKFVIRYNTVPFYFNNPPGVSGEIILYESTNIIDVMVTEVTGSAATKVLGIEDPNGAVGYTPAGRNNVNWTVTTSAQEGWRFAPSAGTFTYLWTPNGPGSGLAPGDQLLQAPSANPTTTTTYTITISNSTGCTTSATTTVTVNPLPVVALGPDSSLCMGDNVILNAGNPGSTYSWSTGATTQTITVSTAGTYSVLVTAPGGCTGTDTRVITVNPSPTVSIGNDTTFCQGGSVMYNAGNPGATYLWSNSATTQTITVTTSGTYSVIVTNASGCSRSDSAVVTVNPLPVVALGPDQTICGSIMLDAQNPGSTYSWSNGATTQQTTVNLTGSYAVTVTTPAGCTNRDTINITVSPAPVVALGNDTSVCPNGSYMLDAGNPGDTYSWSTGATTQTISVNNAGSYYVIVTDPAGCSNSDTIAITAFALPVVALGNDTTLCAGPLTLDAGNPGDTYLWSNATTNQMLTVNTTGTYSVIVTNANGCSNSDTINVTITPAPLLNLGPDTTLCANSVLLDAGNPGSTYLWSNSATTQQITINSSGTYSVLVTNPSGCSATDTVTLTLNAPPVPNAGNDASICIGDSVVLNANNGFTSYLWQWSTNSATTQSIIDYPTVTTTYTLTVTNAAGCTGVDLVTITVDQPPTGNFTFSVSNLNVVTFTNFSTGSSPLTFNWNFGDASPNSTLANPIHTYAANGTYTVTLTVTNNCGSSTFTQTVTITGLGFEDLTMDGTISVYPNPSGGLFNISVGADLDQLQVEIFDLSGKMVYGSRDEHVQNGFIKQVDLQQLADGMYSIRINTGDVLRIGKLIISK